ncbi:hypothetical protein U1Q18_015633 [Sarracenia purpurea var. burkii]
MANPVQHNNDSDLVESLALWEVVKLTKDLGIINIHVEGDLLTVVKAINFAGIDRSHIGGITEAIKAELNLFTNSICSHMRRKGNSISHELVRLATMINEPMNWVGDIYPPRRYLVAAEAPSGEPLAVDFRLGNQCSGSPDFEFFTLPPITVLP